MTEASSPAPRTDGKPLLRTEGLSRRYGGLVAVSELTFALHPGEILGLIGPNGAGKSTTFNLISGFVKPSAGRLFFGATDVTGDSATRISRRGLVRTFQHGSLLREMTVRDNILVGTFHALKKTERAARIQETASLLGLTEVLDEAAGRLPHGTQRMISIAIALASRPTILCLDEPLTGLNQTEVAGALDAIRRIRDEHGTAILFVEHNMRAVMKLCDRLIVLNHGELLCEGTPEEVTKDDRVISAYLGRRK
ncbi:branched-chain amino acid transport system ATP-binding protein [Rhodoligotrophos appendicifer]|uniref:ABC transporter ATP-binding protein n=1 Tax=Rhodoligotrophos appendicifer TaxID=987056 RepID=UPI0011869D41|nr:ABC transporter ATP-binding protein [Rhodoligotrophos appendicifer]